MMNISIQIKSISDDNKWTTVCTTRRTYLNNVITALQKTYEAREFRAIDENLNEVEYDIY